jgi:hypothetical protein
MAGAGLVLLSCGGLRAEIASVQDQTCGTVLRRYEVLSRDPKYSALSREDREGYEVRVARCALTLGKYDLAIALPKTWSDHLSTERDEVEARASAGLHDEDSAHLALASYAESATADEDLLLNSPEFLSYEGQDWFVRLALRLWARQQDASLHDFAKHVVGGDLLPLRVAAADPHRAPGSWAVWTGIVTDARLDSKGDQTLLLAEGVDIKNEDHGAQSVTTRATFSGETAHVETKAETRTYEEAFVPNGHKFMVRYPHARDSLAAMHTIVAFGHFAGRDPEGEMPVLDAFIVRERKAERTVQKE